MNLTISDPTLRDGNHACGHSITEQQIKLYCKAADAAGIDIVEVGHGNGAGASSMQLGYATCSDELMYRTARAALPHAKLGIHVIPGFATIERDLKLAVDCGVDVFRIASHVTEADLCARHIEFVRHAGRTAFGVLMMSHMAPLDVLAGEVQKLVSYGAQTIVLMDSAGASMPEDVEERVRRVWATTNVPVGFHAHNNLGMAVANTIAALNSGASLLDGTILGFGAGAGNTPLEVLVAVLTRLGYGNRMNVKLDKVLELAEMAAQDLGFQRPTLSAVSVTSGLAGVFSGFAKPVRAAATKYGVSPHAIFRKLGERGAVAGQEDLIVEVAEELAKEGT